VKPKQNYHVDPSLAGPMDCCQTPAYALEPLIPYLDPAWTIWESACGEGSLVAELTRLSFNVVGTDIKTGHNFFGYQPPVWDVQVTNPPYGVKYAWIEHSFQLGKPFALLIPVEALGAGSVNHLLGRLNSPRQIGAIFMDKRVNFKMPNKGYGGAGAQFPTCWLCYGLDLPQQMVWAEIHPKTYGIQPLLFQESEQ